MRNELNKVKQDTEGVHALVQTLQKSQEEIKSVLLKNQSKEHHYVLSITNYPKSELVTKMKEDLDETLISDLDTTSLISDLDTTSSMKYATPLEKFEQLSEERDISNNQRNGSKI